MWLGNHSKNHALPISLPIPFPGVFIPLESEVEKAIRPNIGVAPAYGTRRNFQDPGLHPEFY